ncbi:signal peptidase I [Halorubrum salinum]|uniref:signal peptidase I n=1 Tax=Halorubrum salinum TaxID=767517 RepID=UPI0021116240|nr:signal peptidase I [Halorubrum salinum]
MTPTLTPRMKRAANVLGIAVLIVLVAPFAVYAAPEVVGADESFVVLTPSMTPAIAPGDVVVVAERDPTTVVEDDVITFVRGSSDVPVTHRVIGVVSTAGGVEFETKGDANEGPDPGLVPGANLVGVVVLTIPYIGYVIQFAGTRAGFLALVVLPFGLLVASELWSIVRSRSDDAGDALASTDPETPAGSDAGADPDVEAGPEAPAGSDAGADPDVAETVADSTTAADETGGISVDAVGGATAVLAVFAPYAAYAAVELRSAASIAVAVASATVLFGALAVWVPASGVVDRVRPGDSASSSERSAEPVTVDPSSAPAADETPAPTAQTDGSGEVE